MKKYRAGIILAAVLMLVAFICSSCKTSSPPAPLATSFTAQVQVKKSNCCNPVLIVTTTGRGITTITYSEPAILKGLAYSYSGDILTLKHSGLSYSPVGKLPNDCLPQQLNRVLNIISEKQPFPNIQPKGDITEHSNSEFTVTAETKSGKIIKIEMKKEAVRYVFTYK